MIIWALIRDNERSNKYFTGEKVLHWYFVNGIEYLPVYLVGSDEFVVSSEKLIL